MKRPARKHPQPGALPGFPARDPSPQEPALRPESCESLEGAIEKIVFYNPENGYSVCRFKTEDGAAVTLVGFLPPFSPGESLRVSGRWETNSRFGRQFRVDRFVMALPASAAGMERFLSSGLVKGVGPVLARKIVETFGDRTMDILNAEPQRLREVEGIGPAKLREILKSWEGHSEIRDLILFLQDHAVSTGLAVKIHRHYGDKAFHVLQSNPYRMSQDIWGIGFKTADAIALKLGIDPSSPERVKAYILHILEKCAEEGHVFFPASSVAESVSDDLGLGREIFSRALEALILENKVVREKTESDEALYLPQFHLAENEVARRLDVLSRSLCTAPDFDVPAALDEAEGRLGLKLSALQKSAIRSAVEKKVLIITGGPGTGKTTIIRAVAEIFQKWGKTVLMAAPTGRAARRLAETSGKDAKTLHRTLEFRPKDGVFKRNDRHPLEADVLIVDEFSMVDLLMMHHLLKAVPPAMRLVFVGDKDQIPSVGPGRVFGDVIDSGIADVVRLDQIFRQDRESYLVLNAHRVNQGRPLIYPPREDRESDFYFVRREEEDKAFQTIMTMCRFSIPRRLNLPPLSTGIQVISPMYKGRVGVDNLNRELQASLNPGPVGLRLGGREFRVRDKVMQIRNDYEKDIYNGDIGTIVHIDGAKARICVLFDGRPVVYEKDEADDLVLAYAISVHKAQGSEYQAVVLPLLTQHFIMLQRNLFYTALTRAKSLSVVVGSAKALHIAIKNDKPVNRNARLKEKLTARKGGKPAHSD
jgi:exodeoxyribonuclease V alpha subunit